MKVIVTVMVTLLLNILCEQGLGVVSWIIVFIPFILMTVIVSMLLYIFGLDTATGTLKYGTKNCGSGVTIDASGNVIIYDPSYNPVTNPVYYKSPNIIVPNSNYGVTTTTTITQTQPQYQVQQIYYPTGSSSPAYQS